MREAIPLRLIDKLDVRRQAGNLLLPIILALAVLSGLPSLGPADVLPAEARRRVHTVRHVRVGPPVARRHAAARPARMTVRHSRRPVPTGVRVRRRAAVPAAPPTKTAVAKPGQKRTSAWMASRRKSPVHKASGKKSPVLKAWQKKAPVVKASHKAAPVLNASQKKIEAQKTLPTTPIQLDQRTIFKKVYSLRDQGLNEQLAGDYGSAVRHLMEAAQLSSTYYVRPSAAESLLYMDLATCAEQAGLNSVARQAYAQLLERSPRSAEARIRMGGLLARLGHVREATSMARRAIELDPASPRAHLLLALLLEHQGNLAEARTERDSSKALLESRPVIRQPEPESKSPEAQTGDFTPSGPEDIDEGPPGLP